MNIAHVSPNTRSFIRVAASAYAIVAGTAQADFQFKDTENQHLDILLNGKTIARYQYAYDKSTPERLNETYKPIFHVFKPDGSAPITKGAGGQFTHHRGWFIGWSKISVKGDTIDRWHMKGGSIIHQKFLAQEAGAKSATLKVQLAWEGKDAAPVIEEQRTLVLTEGPAPAYLQVEMQSELKSLAGEIKLDGDPEHAGFQFRPSEHVDVSKTTYLFPRAEADPTKDLDYPWVAENFFIQDKNYHVAFLNHPDNPTETRFSAYRDYGRFGGFFRGVIPENGTFRLKARLLVAEGAPLSAETIQKAANSFTGKNDPTPQTTERSAAVKAAPKKNSDAKKTEAPETPNAPKGAGSK